MASIQDIKRASGIAGVTPQAVARAIKKTGNPAVWSAFYAASNIFAVKPGFNHNESCKYADARVLELMEDPSRYGISIEELNKLDIRTHSPKDNKAFIRWFGESCVVDSQGEPLVVYHGAKDQFSCFREDMKGSNTGWDNTGLGFFFLADKKLTEDFQAMTHGGETIIDVYLSLQKPINLTLKGILTLPEQAPTIWEILSHEQLPQEEALESLNENIDLGSVQELWEGIVTEHARSLMIRDGYDGGISRYGTDNGSDILEYIAFYPEQIKSASGNSGKYDPSSKNIYDEPESEEISQLRDYDLSALDVALQDNSKSMTPSID